MDKVVVLMSAYNGEKYIKEQIDSILNQVHVDIELVVRDDGSNDATVEILNKYREENANIIVIEGKNVGWRQSFAELLLHAPESEFYAFADQDDYWMENKLFVAVENIKQFDNIPCLYRGRSYIADSELNNTWKKFQNIPILSTTRSLYQNYCQGCTLVFNKKLRELYLRYPIKTVSHDVWLPMIALHTGKIVDDSEAYMLYRIHSSNASAGQTWLKTMERRLKGITKKSASKYDYNYGEALYRNYRDCLNEESIEICHQMATYRQSIKTKIKLLFNKEVRGNTVLRTIMVKYFILTNSYRCY